MVCNPPFRKTRVACSSEYLPGSEISLKEIIILKCLEVGMLVNTHCHLYSLYLVKNCFMVYFNQHYLVLTVYCSIYLKKILKVACYNFSLLICLFIFETEANCIA